ncbi:hypothetical protein GCM10028895_09410 [Pontibacter rugosus]
MVTPRESASLPAPVSNAVTSSSESSIKEQVIWSTTRRLSWDDFKGQPDDTNPHHALTAANLAVNAKCKDNSYTYVVNCVFLPSESWSKNKASEKLLVHEQLHFDLTEVHARQLRRDLQKLSCTSVKTSLNSVVSLAFSKWKAEQDAFDSACKHGLNKEEEKIWAAAIDTRLQELEAYQ